MSQYSPSSPNYQQNTSADNELLECSKCGVQVEQILALQCDHSLCLACSAKVVQKWNKQYDLQTVIPPLKCELCGTCTMLDPSAIQILLEMGYQTSVNKSMTSQKQQQSPEYSSQRKSRKTALLGSYPENPLNYNENTQEMRPIEEVQNYDSNVVCQQHASEAALLYCFTCETPCFCMECYLQGLHKNHEVKNVQKSFLQMKDQKVESIWFKIKNSQEGLLNDQCKFTNKKRELVEITAQAKLQIKQSFQELYKVLQQKEKELMQQADQTVQEQISDIDNEIQRLKNHMDKLNGFTYQINSYFPQENSQIPNQQHSIEAFNFIAQNTRKIDQYIQQVQTDRQKQLQLVQINYVFDPQSVSQQIEDIRATRLKISTLRAIETSEPSQQEKYFYDKAREDRSKRLFQGILLDQSQSQTPHSSKFQERTHESVNKQLFDEKKENYSFTLNRECKTQHKQVESLSDFEKKFNEIKKILNDKSQNQKF